MIKKEVNSSHNLVFLNARKYDVAVGIVGMLNGKPPVPIVKAHYSDIESIKARVSELLSEAGIKPTDKEAIRFVYEKLGGGVMTKEKQAKLKERADEVNLIVKKKKEKEEKETEEKSEEDDDDE
jgi:hypothetical protein